MKKHGMVKKIQINQDKNGTTDSGMCWFVKQNRKTSGMALQKNKTGKNRQKTETGKAAKQKEKWKIKDK